VHLGLYVPEEGYAIAVDGVNASWAQGDVLILDDSLVHEVFAPPAAGVPSVRVILIVDIHHPDLLMAERRRVPPFGKRR
jgi:aspartyl/asparaginyl beta-hydroxylase (cupin superfamily)